MRSWIGRMRNSMNIVPYIKVPTMSDIKYLQDVIAQAPQIEFPCEHHHSEGVYVREFQMPAEHVVVGKEHRTRHLNILVKGRCRVWQPGQPTMELSADNGPVTFESMAGVKKIVLAHTDIVWMTIHATDETSQDRLEFEIISPVEQGLLFPELE